jgi:hypothetical protein
MADLYLMRAEAANEYFDTPSEEVWNSINKVRQRAGIPTVQAAYTGPYVIPEAHSKHTTQAGMREIIISERSIEFAFEGHVFWDMIRRKRATTEFNSPVIGWTVEGTDAISFFNRRLLQDRMFTLRDCLWPIQSAELDKNSALIQNPGW